MTEAEARSILEEEILFIFPDADFTEIPDDAELRDELELDSLDFLVLVERLCVRGHCRIDEDDYSELRTMAGSISLLVSRTSAKSAGK